MAFAGPSQSSEDGDSLPMADMNVTPLVDVMLVLLIVFMVAAPMMVVGVPVELPKTAAPRAAAQRPPVVLTVAADGKTFIRQEEVPLAELVTRLRGLHEEDPEAPVYVRGDRSVPYGEVLHVMGRITQSGITRVSLIAEAEAGAGVVQAR
ncbi:ExbD/TolR family protein [Roseomonas sp. KE0001]|uniref:ExbD/TolR family protein n=1 Tax=unclassified Roseomonas TaxID=2617492 RepID=UPI0018E0572D|nr:ExbD/TolR family protein [Roseomonas sp. KE0001]MBI0432821.1 ExbD/TolR family protein [Roseomonas sp. KE0001]